MTSPDWKNMPFEILQRIFEFAKADPDHQISTFNNCQLVCKGWKRAAQEALYDDVCVDPDNVENFVYTVNSQNPFLGTLVKKVTFGDGFARLTNTDLIFDVITYRCPKAYEIYAVNLPQKKMLWTYLATRTNELTYLESFSKQNERSKSLIFEYLHVAMKFKDSLTNLQITTNYSGCILRGRFEDCYLRSKLSSFKSLKHLRVVGFEHNRQEDLDSLIDDCSETVECLTFDSLDWRHSFIPSYNIKQNTHIKHLAIDHADIPAACLSYLSRKLRSLDNLHITNNARFPLLEDELEWWKRLTNLCLPLGRYKVITDMAEIGQASNLLRQKEAINSKALTISAFHAPFNIYSNHDVTLTKNRSTLSLLLNHFQVEQLKHSDTKTTLRQFSPNRIKIIAENMDEFYNRYMVNLPQFTPSRYGNPEYITYKIRRSLARECNERNWLLFHTATHLIDQTKKAFLHFDRMIFCQPPPTELENHQANLSIHELRLTNSIIYTKTFSDISTRSPNINTLIIDTCSILMDEQYSLNIFLPSTTLNSMHLHISPFINATECGCASDETSSLENEDLLHAVGWETCLIFKIETESGVHIVRKEGSNISHISTGKYQHITSGSSDEFLIWIKCEDIKEFVFQGANKTSVIWDKTFLENAVDFQA